MRYAIISDVHANLEALTAVLARIDQDGADQIICLGDVVGYNANPNECVSIIRERGIPTVCGNHDAVASGIEEPWGFNPIALSAAMWTRENLAGDQLSWLKSLPVNITMDHFIASHGSPTDRDCYLFTWEDVLPHASFLTEQGKNLCFFGHTHCPGIFSTDGCYSVDGDNRFKASGDKVFFINVGSVGQPRDGDPRSAFGYFDTDTLTFEQVRVEYPIEIAANRVVSRGLPDFLAERLHFGR